MANYQGNNTSIGLVHWSSTGKPYWQVSFCLNDDDWFPVGFKFSYNPKDKGACEKAENQAEEFAMVLQGKIDDHVSSYEIIDKISEMLNVEPIEKDIVEAVQSLIDTAKL